MCSYNVGPCITLNCWYVIWVSMTSSHDWLREIYLITTNMHRERKRVCVCEWSLACISTTIAPYMYAVIAWSNNFFLKILSIMNYLLIILPAYMMEGAWIFFTGNSHQVLHFMFAKYVCSYHFWCNVFQLFQSSSD